MRATDNSVDGVTSNLFSDIPVTVNIGGRMTTGVLLSYLGAGFLFAIVLQIASLFLLDEIGYGDSIVFYDAMHLQRSGTIYDDLSKPPYTPALYSPLVYMMYAIPGRISAANPFLGPRLVALIMFLLCLAMIVSIVNALVPVRYASIWALMLAGYIKSIDMPLVPIQLRGDFGAIFFSLAAIRLLFNESKYVSVWAGICAGMATQLKITYVAATVAGSLWLFLQNERRRLVLFVASAVLTSAGLYIMFGLWQPRMVSHMLALAPPIRDFYGCAKLILGALSEPVVLFALPAVPLALCRALPAWRLLMLFISISFVIGGLTDIQAGGGGNYFFEALLATVPLSVMGIFQLIAFSKKRFSLALFLTGIILIHFLIPDVRAMYARRSEIDSRTIASQNEVFRKVERVLSGRRIFSTVPRLALLSPQPVVVEPYLLSYLRRLGRFDTKPIVDRIHSEEFDLAVTQVNTDWNWRGVRVIDPEIGQAIQMAYRPYCTILGDVLYLPRSRPEDIALVRQLQRIGCIKG